MVQLILVIIGIYSIHAARILATSSIHLRIRPAGAEKKIYAIHGRDTLPIAGVNGVYSLPSINPGNWQVLVTASTPFKDWRHDLEIGAGQTIDLGEIRLMQ